MAEYKVRADPHETALDKLLADGRVIETGKDNHNRVYVSIENVHGQPLGFGVGSTFAKALSAALKGESK